jgi:hypothetical protein
MRAEGGYNKPDMDLLTATVASFERNQQPFKALNLMTTDTISPFVNLGQQTIPIKILIFATHMPKTLLQLHYLQH